MPDATPARSRGTEFITVVVNGATLIAIPKPSTTTAGKNVVQYEPPMPGLAKSAKPSAAISGRRSAAAGPVTLDQPAGPARQQEHQHDERQQRRAGRGRRVALHLDQVQGKEEMTPLSAAYRKK